MWCKTYAQRDGLLQILGYVNRVRDVVAAVDHDTFTMAEVESNAVRCPDLQAAEQMYTGGPFQDLPFSLWSYKTATVHSVEFRM